MGDFIALLGRRGRSLRVYVPVNDHGQVTLCTCSNAILYVVYIVEVDLPLSTKSGIACILDISIC